MFSGEGDPQLVYNAWQAGEVKHTWQAGEVKTSEPRLLADNTEKPEQKVKRFKNIVKANKFKDKPAQDCLTPSPADWDLILKGSHAIAHEKGVYVIKEGM